MKLATTATPILIMNNSAICLIPKFKTVIKIPTLLLNKPFKIAVPTPVAVHANTN